MQLEEKKKKRQEIQQQITDLNNQLKQKAKIKKISKSAKIIHNLSLAKQQNMIG